MLGQVRVMFVCDNFLARSLLWFWSCPGHVVNLFCHVPYCDLVCDNFLPCSLLWFWSCPNMTLTWVMLGQVRVMLGQVGSCWDRSESCLCVTTFWPVPYCDFDHVRVMLSTFFAMFLIVIWCVTTFCLVPYCDFDHVPTWLWPGPVDLRKPA